MQTIIGTASNLQLYIRGTLDQSWVPARASQGQGAEARAVFPDGKILGLRNSNLFTRATLDDEWVAAPRGSVPIMDVAIFPDGKILGLGHDGQLYARAALDDEWAYAPQFGEPVIRGIAILPDGRILGHSDGNRETRLFTRATLDDDWVAARAVRGQGWLGNVSIFADGSILGLGSSGRLFTRATLDDEWVEALNYAIPKATWSDDPVQILAVATFPYSNPEKTGLHLIDTDKAKAAFRGLREFPGQLPVFSPILHSLGLNLDDVANAACPTAANASVLGSTLEAVITTWDGLLPGMPDPSANIASRDLLAQIKATTAAATRFRGSAISLQLAAEDLMRRLGPTVEGLHSQQMEYSETLRRAHTALSLFAGLNDSTVLLENVVLRISGLAERAEHDGTQLAGQTNYRAAEFFRNRFNKDMAEVLAWRGVFR